MENQVINRLEDLSESEGHGIKNQVTERLEGLAKSDASLLARTDGLAFNNDQIGLCN